MHVVRFKSHRTSEMDKPPAYETVSEEEVILKDRELRSDRPDAYFHQSPKPKSGENTPPLLSPVSNVQSVSQLLGSLRFTPPDIMPTSHILGSTESGDNSTKVEYRDPVDNIDTTDSATSSAYTSPRLIDENSTTEAGAVGRSGNASTIKLRRVNHYGRV